MWESVYFAEKEGLQDLVTMKENTSKILRSYFNAQAKDEESQKQVIIETAARLIESDIKSNVPSLANEYPSAKSLELDYALSFVPGTFSDIVKLSFCR